VELDGHRYIVADGVYAHSITGKIVEDRSSSTASGSGSQNSALDAGSTERQIASAATGFIPYVGEAQDASILIFGYDPVSGEKISRWYGLALFVPFVGGGTVRGAVRGGSALIDEIGEGFEVLSRRWSGGGGGVKAAKLIGNEGYIDPKQVRFTQDSIAGNFKEKDKGSVYDLIDALKSGKVKPEDIPPIRVFEKDGKIYSLDNRRLYAFQQAGVKIRWVRADPKLVEQQLKWKFTTKNDGMSIRVR